MKITQEINENLDLKNLTKQTGIRQLWEVKNINFSLSKDPNCKLLTSSLNNEDIKLEDFEYNNIVLRKCLPVCNGHSNDKNIKIILNLKIFYDIIQYFDYDYIDPELVEIIINRLDTYKLAEINMLHNLLIHNTNLFLVEMLVDRYTKEEIAEDMGVFGEQPEYIEINDSLIYILNKMFNIKINKNSQKMIKWLFRYAN